MPENLKQVIYKYSIPLLILSVVFALSLLAASCAAIDQGGIVNRDPPSKKNPATLGLRVYLDPSFNVTTSAPIRVLIYTNIEDLTRRDFPMPAANNSADSADSASSVSAEQRFYAYTLTSARSVAISSQSASSASTTGRSSSSNPASSINSSSSSTGSLSSEISWGPHLSELYVEKIITVMTNSVIYLLAWHDENGDGILSKGEIYIGYDAQTNYNALTEARMYASYMSLIKFKLNKYSYHTGTIKITVKYTGDEDMSDKKLNASLHKTRNFGTTGTKPRYSKKIEPKSYYFIFPGIDDPTVYIRVWLSDDDKDDYAEGDPVSLYNGPATEGGSGLGSDKIPDATPFKLPPDIPTYLSVTMEFDGESTELTLE